MLLFNKVIYYSSKCDLPTNLRNAFILQFFVIYQVTILSFADQYDENCEQGIWFVLCTVVCIVHGGLYCARWFVLCTEVCIVHGGLYCAQCFLVETFCFAFLSIVSINQVEITCFYVSVNSR